MEAFWRQSAMIRMHARVAENVKSLPCDVFSQASAPRNYSTNAPCEKWWDASSKCRVIPFFQKNDSSTLSASHTTKTVSSVPTHEIDCVRLVRHAAARARDFGSGEPGLANMSGTQSDYTFAACSPSSWSASRLARRLTASNAFFGMPTAWEPLSKSL